MIDKPRFQIRMIGERVAPDTVRAGDLAALVENLEAAVTAAGGPEALSIDSDEAVISLVGVENGSNKLTFAVAQAALVSVSAISVAVSTADYRRLPPKTHEKLHEISKQAARKDWAVEFVGDSRMQITSAIISSEHPIPPPARTTVSAPTTIWGRLMRVGGAKPRAEIRLPGGQLLFFDLTAGLAKQLSDGLYETVSVEGIATWTVDTRELTDFKATRVTGYRPEKTSLTGAFEQLALAAKGRWDTVDVTRFIDDLRSES